MRQCVSVISLSSQACNRTRPNLGPFCYVMNTNYNLLVTCLRSVLKVAGQPVSYHQTRKLMTSCLISCLVIVAILIRLAGKPD